MFFLAIKASFQQNNLVLILLSVVVLFFILSFFIVPFKSSLNSYSEKSCNSFIKTKFLFSKFDVNIPFSSSKNFCSPSFIKIKSSDDNTVKKVFSDSLINCWKEYGRGSVELFSKTGKKFYCVLCSHMTFEEKNKKISGFKQYLLEKKVPYYPYKDYTYMEFLSNCDLEPCEGEFYFFDATKKESSESLKSVKNFQNNILDEIDTSKDYATLYLIYENNALLKKLDALKYSLSSGGIVAMVLLPTIGSVPILVIGSAVTIVSLSTGKVLFEIASKNPEWNAGVTIIPYDEETLKGLECENLVINNKT